MSFRETVVKLARHGAFVALALTMVGPTAATTLVRSSLDDLVRDNRIVVLGEVVDAYSYWNRGGTFILTDVRIAVEQGVKGSVDSGDIVVTLMGGTVGDLSTVIVGGARLVPGHSYVLFLNPEDLPGAPSALTVRDHSQGAFEVVETAQGRRAVSQAAEHALLPDAAGRAEPPGGDVGMPLAQLVSQLQSLVGTVDGGGEENR